MEPTTRRSSDSFQQLNASKHLIPTFEAHLKVLNDSYLTYFAERKRIEETYIDSLLRLHKKIKTTDAYLDRTEFNTTRSAWNDVRDNTERGQAGVPGHTLGGSAESTDITPGVSFAASHLPLIHPKETQERTKKRIKEDLKDSTQSYDDFAENGLPRLKAKYAKKFAEVEESKRAAAVVPPLSPTALAPGTDVHTSPKSNAANAPLRVTSPQPLRALERRHSGSAPRNRSPSASTSTAFSDLAQQGKKQFSRLLEKSGTVKESLGTAREPHALKAVRAKRELDEADKEYRNGVHWLETLRLRRAKILESGFRSLEGFVHETSTLVKVVLEKYTDNLTATHTTQAQLATHARSVVNKIAPEVDIVKVSSTIPRSLESAIPERILYHNGFVGECQDLIFGFSLLDYATAHNLPDGLPPKLVQICVAEIDKRGLSSEGIYRVSGRHAVVQTLQHEIERDESKFEFKPKDDIYAVASLLKLYLRELPEPVFKFSLQDRIQHTEDIADHQSNNFMLLRSKIRRLPPVHQATLKIILEHLSRVVSKSSENKMDAKNVAIVFGSVIFGEDDPLKAGTDLLNLAMSRDSLMEDLILHAHVLYDDHPVQHSPPLPATPAGEPVPQLYYGSKRTQITSVPPASPINRNETASPQDFTPRLPARPTSSIHPSARANPPPSPTKDRVVVPPPPPVPSSPTVSTTTFETDSIATRDDATSYLERWRAVRTLIVDEISMLDGKIFDKLEKIARIVRGNDLPFGGIQLVISGDFFQLPPVPDRKCARTGEDSELPVVFAFESETWDLCLGPPVTLTHVFRQKARRFVDLLNAMRFGVVEPKDTYELMGLSREVEYSDGIQPTQLLSRKFEVENANQLRLSELPGEELKYVAVDLLGLNSRGFLVTQPEADRLLEKLVVRQEIFLRVGAQVMLIKNVVQGRLVNGSVGQVTRLCTAAEADKDGIVLVRDLITNEKNKRTPEEYGLARVMVHPRVLAWHGAYENKRARQQAMLDEEEEMWEEYDESMFL
ncbi:Glucosamine 6-phosphate N-acetyltransferase [Mycena kentingensis (nom. inval.)]|nr:Glucosamine 6-phosphate N-acetyltransferase [Mycena kentingensis (nom. inval.)]